MPLLLYNFFLTILALLALPCVGLALLLRPRYRAGLVQRLGSLPPAVRQCTAGQTPLWLHGPSVGEILATRPFLQALKQSFPGQPLLLSVLTPTAYVAAHTRLPEADAVIYSPLDYPVFIARVLDQVKPTAFFFTETEIWPNLLAALMRRGVPTILVSGRFSQRALARYRLLHSLFHPLFQNLTLCCMQTQADAERLIAAGVPPQQVIVTGNFKLDGVSQGGADGQRILQEAGLADRLLLIASSTHRGEEELLLQAAKQLRQTVPNLLLLLAPRHPQRFAEVEKLLVAGGYHYWKRSYQGPGARAADDIEVFLLDTLGELSSFYSCAAVAFVGGSLVKGPGGHNVIEPALAQVPVCFGPYTSNFAPVAEELQRAGGGSEIRDLPSLCAWALPLLMNTQARQQAGRHAYTVIKRGQGAVERTLTAVKERIQNGAQQLVFNRGSSSVE